MYKWKVKKSERGVSLENFLYKQMGNWSHKQIKRAIDHKRAFVNGRNIFVAKWNLKPNDLVLFVPTFQEKEKPLSRYQFVEVLYEDSYLLAANKPPFVDYETYAETVKNYLKRQTKGQGYPYVGQVHRLDKETSGVMLFTKKKSANTLLDQFREHQIKKFYLALVRGQLQKDEGTVTKAIEKGEFGEGKKVRVVNQGSGKEAHTHYRVVERYRNATLLRVEIKTGRTHQIRIHMSDLGFPIVGDKLYGDDKALAFKRQVLHAERVDFVHPVTGKKIRVVAPLPKDLEELIDRLRMEA